MVILVLLTKIVLGAVVKKPEPALAGQTMEFLARIIASVQVLRLAASVAALAPFAV